MASDEFIPGKSSLIPSRESATTRASRTEHRIFLAPGDFHVSMQPAQITTILVSCVSIVLWDAKTHFGGMNHYLFPEWLAGEGPSTRFGNVATLHLLSDLLDLGCDPKNIKAKVFGGAALFARPDCYPTSLGAKNVEIAHRMMERAGIPIIGQDTGGQHGRKIIFDTADCSAWSRKV